MKRVAVSMILISASFSKAYAACPAGYHAVGSTTTYTQSSYYYGTQATGQGIDARSLACDYAISNCNTAESTALNTACRNSYGSNATYQIVTPGGYESDISCDNTCTYQTVPPPDRWLCWNRLNSLTYQCCAPN